METQREDPQSDPQDPSTAPLLQYERNLPGEYAPGALKAVAYVFIALGVLAAVGMVIKWVNGRVTFNIAVLGIFIGMGLLKRSAGWRACGLVVLWIQMILIAVVVVLFFLGEFLRGITGAAVLGVCLGIFALNIWQYRVLVRADVKAWFEYGNRRAQ